MTSTIAGQFGVRAQLEIVPPFGPGVLINPDVSSGATQSKMSWRVKKGIGGGSPAECAVQVTNLGQSSRDRAAGNTRRVIDLTDEFAFLDGRLVTGADLGGKVSVSTGTGFGTLTLSARYQGSATTSTLFDGTSQLVTSEHRRHTWVTNIRGADGLIQQTSAIADKFWGGTVGAAEVIEYLVRRVMVAELATTLPVQLSGYSFIGGYDATNFYATDILDQLTTLTGTQWWWDDGAVFFSALGQPLPGPPLILSPGGEEGTLRTLERPRRVEGADVRVPTLLIPEMRPNRLVELRTREFGGQYYASVVEHEGSNRGGVSRTLTTLTPVGVVGFL